MPIIKENIVIFNAEKNVLAVFATFAVATLVYISQTGDVLLGGAALFLLAVSMEMQAFVRRLTALTIK